jgi:hypothetical protein
MSEWRQRIKASRFFKYLLPVLILELRSRNWLRVVAVSVPRRLMYWGSTRVACFVDWRERMSISEAMWEAFYWMCFRWVLGRRRISR